MTWRDWRLFVAGPVWVVLFAVGLVSKITNTLAVGAMRCLLDWADHQ